MIKKALFILFLITLCISGFADGSDFYYAWALFFNPNLDPNAGLTMFPSLFIPMGGKYEGMGTAYTAVSDDISFIESNPAGSATLAHTELGFLHHSWIMDSNIEGVVFATRFGDMGLAGSAKFLYVPFTEKDEWGRTGGTGYYTETIGTFNISYNLLRSFYFDGLSVGSNIKLAYMGISDSIYPGQSVLAGLVDVGVLTRFNLLKFYTADDNNFSIGAAFKNYSPIPTTDPMPTMLSAGISYSPIRPLTLAFDFNLPISFDSNFPAENWYLAAGLSLAFTQNVILLSGVKLKASNPIFSLGVTIELDTMAFVVNYSLDLTNSIDPLDKFSIAAKFNLGDEGRSKVEGQADDLYLQGLDLFAEGDLAGAIALWKKVLEIDPEYTPAKDYIDIAQEKMRLEKEIIDRQKFD